MVVVQNIEYEFEYFQIDITNACNLSCKHCRNNTSLNQSHLDLNSIKKVIDFGRLGNSPRFTISGGEPLLHPELKNIIEYWINAGGNDTVITSNGLLINEKWIEYFKYLPNFRIQISIDSLIAAIHDNFRGKKGALQNAINAIRLLKQSNISVSIRSSISPENISSMEELVKFGIQEGIDRFAIGFIIATGKAMNNNLHHTPRSKKEAIEKLKELRLKYSDVIAIENTDPLQCHAGFIELEGNHFKDELLFGGCNAGISGFYCNSIGEITPCSFLPISVLNINEFESSEILHEYQASDIIANLVLRNYKGNCRDCDAIRICGGCRANALGISGDYLASDPTCWKKFSNVEPIEGAKYYKRI